MIKKALLIGIIKEIKKKSLCNNRHEASPTCRGTAGQSFQRRLWIDTDKDKNV